jgi:cell shape-determining protein MreC
MDTHTLWLLALSLATPIAGVVGFAVQLRQVKRTRLENEKLLLELEALRQRAIAVEQRVQRVTTEEVIKYSRSHGDVMFSRSTGERAASRAQSRMSAAKNYAVNLLVLMAVALVVMYLVYDAYRIVLWLVARL